MRWRLRMPFAFMPPLLKVRRPFFSAAGEPSGLLAEAEALAEDFSYALPAGRKAGSLAALALVLAPGLASGASASACAVGVSVLLVAAVMVRREE